MNKFYRFFIVFLVIINIVMCIININLYSQNNELESRLVTDIKDLSRNDYMLYKGFLVDRSKILQNPHDMLKSMYDENDFNGLYYNYSNGKFLGKTVGFTAEYYLDSFCVENVNKYSFTKLQDVLPRNVDFYDWVDNEIMNKYPQIRDYSDRWSIGTDLDGDGNKEYIVCVNDEKTAYSCVELYDSKGNKIDRLIYIEEGYWAGMRSDDYKLFITNKDIEVFDIDNDGIMEILVESPAYEGKMIAIFKYDGEKIVGETNIDAEIYLSA